MRTCTSTLILSGALLIAGGSLLIAADADNAAPAVKPPVKVPFPTLPPGATPSVLPANAAATTAVATNGGPKIQFANPVYDFGRVKSGDPVKFTYIFTNIGDQVLELSNVQPQCGCTAAGDWTRKVEPGQTGTIPIQFNTSSYSQPVVKNVTVSCNDKSQPVVVLQLKGTVWKPIEFIPPYLVMNVMPDAATTTGTVRIVNNTEEALQLSDPQSNNQSYKAELKPTTPGKEYQLTIVPVGTLTPGTVQGKVTLKSSSTNSPSVEVPFWVNVQAPVAILPVQIALPAGPLASKANPSVTIQNNTTNALKISDASINVPGVEVAVKELTPGRIFTLQLSVPEGFELPAGQKALVTFKTSHPQFPTMEVPVVQMPKPNMAQQPIPLNVPQKPPLKFQPVTPANGVVPTISTASGSGTSPAK